MCDFQMPDIDISDKLSCLLKLYKILTPQKLNSLDTRQNNNYSLYRILIANNFIVNNLTTRNPIPPAVI